MEIKNHKIIRAHRGPSGQMSARSQADSKLPQDTFAPSSKPDNFPDISGLTAFSRNRTLAVKDTKLEDDSKRVLLLNNGNGAVKELEVDWSRTGRARDLEAITPGSGKGSYLAVEGSSFGDNKARLFELTLNSSGGEAKKSHLLPDFGQEVEGLVSVPGENGSQTVLFGGRGDENGNSTVFWGTLSEEGLSFTPEGLKGQAIESPHLGPGQRSIADMAADKNGQLWATAAVDNGDEGPFDSLVYPLGKLTGQANQPLEAKTGPSVSLPGTKAEAITFARNGSFLVGSDNESLGGRFEQFNIVS